ncbi:insulinase family protein [Thermoleophilia bacterium SCSIO 60948]|nr:insulinase family protein [Thermoleophilia bacterium SCSIO 60948]
MSLPENVDVTELGDGLRVVTEYVPGFRSVALGMWARTGSRDEEPREAGISHFLEHLLFKGTDRHSAIEISELFDSMGAASNAATSKESTHLHARFLDEHTTEAFELMADMFMRPALPEGEIDSEREVVLEEIAMYEDEPSDRVHDVLAEAIYGDHPLGRRVLGSSNVIANVPVPEIAAYHRERYAARNLVVSAAGNVEHDRVVGLAERLLGDAGESDPRPTAHPPGVDPRFCFQAKDTEQFHICFGGHGISRGDERRFALAVLDTIFGGAVSSRLFREIREKRGLAYSVGSYTEQFVDRGAVAMYVGTRADNVAEACEIIGRELRSLGSDGVTPGELARAKEHIKGRMVLSLESTGSRMSRLARAVLFDLPVQSLDELIARVEAVSVEDVAELAAEIYDPSRLSAACIGADEDTFRRAVGAVDPALAAA